MNNPWRSYVAEMIGAFGLSFIGAGTIITMKQINAAPGVDLIGIAIAHGIILSVMVSALGSVSGAHVNPAVTFGVWIIGKIDTAAASGYIVSQLIGATVAGFMVKAIYTPVMYEAVHGGTPALAQGVSVGTGILVEAVLTFFLVTAVMGTAVSHKAPKIGGFGIGLTIAACILMGGPLTGASMNPSRTFGPGLAAGYWTGHVVYWVGPLLGGGLAAWVYAKVFGLDPEN